MYPNGFRNEKCSLVEFQLIAGRVLGGMKHERCKEASDEAYSEALTIFAPGQMRALHRKMRVLENELYERDALTGCY
jgi:glycerol dehydrogenase-like iron-containing ADH family enzyme